MNWSYFGLITLDWWAILLAYIGTLGLPALVASLWLPDLAERAQRALFVPVGFAMTAVDKVYAGRDAKRYRNWGK